MNKLIKKLEKQSCVTTTTKVKSGAWDNDRPPYRYINVTETKFSAEKFAELIVQECINVCLAQRDPANLNYKPSEQFAEEIKLRFGVK